MMVAVTDISFWQLRDPHKRATKPWHVCGCIGVHQTVKRGGSRRVPRPGRGRAHGINVINRQRIC